MACPNSPMGDTNARDMRQEDSIISRQFKVMYKMISSSHGLEGVGQQEKDNKKLSCLF